MKSPVSKIASACGVASMRASSRASPSFSGPVPSRSSVRSAFERNPLEEKARSRMNRDERERALRPPRYAVSGDRVLPGFRHGGNPEQDGPLRPARRPVRAKAHAAGEDSLLRIADPGREGIDVLILRHRDPQQVARARLAGEPSPPAPGESLPRASTRTGRARGRRRPTGSRTRRPGS